MTRSSSVPVSRIRQVSSAPLSSAGDYVLYWMIAFRRTTANFSLQRAIELAEELGKPLLIFEPLRLGYRWASDRIHRFVLEGMADNAERMARLNNPAVHYYPYVERRLDDGKGLLAALSAQACAIVTDDFPSFFLPRMVAAAAARSPVQMESVDSNGLLPLRATDRVFTTAFSFRAFLQKELPRHLDAVPVANPLARLRLPPFPSLPEKILRRWPPATLAELANSIELVSQLPLDHSVTSADRRGGSQAARQLLRTFLDRHLQNYATGANDPDEDHRSGLSPYLHFGHISPHELWAELRTREEWSPQGLGANTAGKREGWWGVSPGAEAWLDELVTWRELGYNMSSHREDYDQFESLPDWAQATLAKHAADPRKYIYSLPQLDAAKTHDELWNAAQRQLVREGRIHNYLRMLWGKKILEWSATPQEAAAAMIELNNRYAVDGRNPNSYSGIFWVLGRYDRPWGPERPIFGTVRYMSSENTRRKVKVTSYLQRFGPEPRPGQLNLRF